MKLKKVFKNTLLSLIAAVMSPIIAYAAPSIASIDGVIANGQTVQVNGTGFGTKANIAPILWDTVDNQSAYSALNNGATIPTGGTNPWGENGNNAGVGALKLSTTGDRNGKKCYTSNTVIGTLQNLSLGSSPSAVYVSWWWKPSASPTSGNHSTKFLRLSNASYLTSKTFSWTQQQSYVWNDPNYAGSVDWGGWNGTVNAWNFHEVWFDNIGKTYTLRVNGKSVTTNHSWATNGGFVFNYIWMIGWDGGGVSPFAITQWMDDIYVDTSLARVMIGNASTYSASTHFEMQIPNALWNSGQIRVSINQGSFLNNSTAYLYVVDSTGAVNSNGYLINFGSSGGGGGNKIPSAPIAQ